MKKLLLSLLVIVTLSFGTALDDAQIAIKKEDFATAIKIMAPLAEQEKTEALVFMGMLYAHAYENKKLSAYLQKYNMAEMNNETYKNKAIYLLEKAEKQMPNDREIKNSDAYIKLELALANLYSKGKDKNYTKALVHYEETCKSNFKLGCLEYQALKVEIIDSKRELAGKGDVKTQYELALMYYKGQEVEKNIKESIYWFEQAANQGDTDAQYNLGLIYHNGEVVAQDYIKADYWYGKACKKGLFKACNKVGVIEFEYSMKLAEQGDPEAQCRVGDYCYSGTIIEKDLRKALYWFKKSCDNGYAEGCERYKDLNKN